MFEGEWKEFKFDPNPKEYKGFKLKDYSKINTSTGRVRVMFSNGSANIFAEGENMSDAYQKAFKKIDQLTDSES